MKTQERHKAIELRRQGMTFSEILQEIPVSRGSLSYWCRSVTLAPEHLARTQYKNAKIKNKFIEFNRLRSLQSTRKKDIIVNAASQEIGNLSNRELKLIGTALYWAEGHKAHAKSVDFVNTDPRMIKLMMRWLREICGVEERRFRIRITVHDATNAARAVSYWSKMTGMPTTQFTKVYTKISPTSKQKTGSLAPYGMCAIRVSDVKLITKIKGWINGLMALSSSLV